MKDYADDDVEQDNFLGNSVNEKKCYDIFELSGYLDTRAKDPDTRLHLEQCPECAKKVVIIKTGRSSAARKEMKTQNPELRGKSLTWLISQSGYPIKDLKASDLEIKDEDLTAGM
jgi:kynurenine formamidase